MARQNKRQNNGVTAKRRRAPDARGSWGNGRRPEPAPSVQQAHAVFVQQLFQDQIVDLGFLAPEN
ncbi:hypothetical protein, partial [Weissella cibaria]|uniref:hypothetical protein n=1 Tax=Weissella cibaria TaxID=137591 RepID=UPI00215AE88A